MFIYYLQFAVDLYRSSSKRSHVHLFLDQDLQVHPLVLCNPHPNPAPDLDVLTIGEMSSLSAISGIGNMGFKEEEDKDESDEEILALQKEIAKCQKDLKEKKVNTFYYT